MNPKDTKALELIRDFLVHHDAETNVSAKIAVSGDRLMRVRIVRKPPAWLEFLRELLERSGGG